MFVCISPSESDLHETLTTMQYASRARSVQNKVVANISTTAEDVNTVDVVAALHSQVLHLQRELAARNERDRLYDYVDLIVSF